MTENEMTGLLLQLADLGVTGIRIHYEGAGDSGAIESINYTTEEINEPSDVLDNVDSFSSENELIDLNSKIAELIESWTNDKLINDIENWWDNEGGNGDVCICVPSGKYCIYNSVRIIEYEEYTHDGNVIDKTLE
jgi:hypothetical protein